jgi:poly(ADP-ribose) glycohydrolase ARH3
MSRRTRARGVLLGLALGDALGAPFEGHPHVSRAQVEEWRDAPEPLRWTDDTHMAVTLARHLVEDPGLTDPRALGVAFADAFRAEPWRGYGSGPPQVFALVAKGLSFEEAAGSLFDGSGSYGNGAAMRVAPVGLLPAASDNDVAERLAGIQARVTHTHPEAVEGATVVAQLVADLLALDRVDTDVLLEVVGATTERLAAGPVRDRLHEVMGVLRSGGDATSAAERCGTGVAAAASVPAAVAALLSGRNLTAVVTVAVQLGGDTDTIAAMAGAMAGAAWGLEQVPARLVDRLEAREELEELAMALSSAR